DIREKFWRNLNVCPNCEYHRRIRASDYANLLIDDGTQEELEVELRSTDPLGFPEYPQRLKKALANAGDSDALFACGGMLDGLPINLDPDQSHDRRRERELRDARRRNSRGAWGRHRLRGPACHQTDARSGSARGLSDERVPTRPRDARHGGAPQAAQGDRRLASASYVGPSSRRGVGARIAALEEALNFLSARPPAVYKLALEAPIPSLM